MKIRYITIFISVLILSLLYADLVLSFSAEGNIIYSMWSASVVTCFIYGIDQCLE